MERGRLVRSGRIDDVTAAASLARTVRLRWIGDTSSVVQDLLGQNPKVSQLKMEVTDGSFQFAGSEEELAQVLAALVAMNVRLVSFTEHKQTVEDIYMKLSHHEVM